MDLILFYHVTYLFLSYTQAHLMGELSLPVLINRLACLTLSTRYFSLSLDV